MKIRISGLSVALILLLLLFLASEIISPELQAQNTPVSKPSGYKVIDTRGNMVEPRGRDRFCAGIWTTFPMAKFLITSIKKAVRIYR